MPRSLFLAALTCCTVSACGGSANTDPIHPRAVTTISITPSDLTLESLGATLQLQASAKDQNGDVISAQFTWGSSDTTVVTVDADGLVTARNNGMTAVTVRSGSIAASTTVTVNQTPARIAVSPDEFVFTALGESHLLEVGILDANDNAMSAALTWTTSDPAIVAVDDSGTIAAQANGTAIINATAGSVSDAVAVTVQQAVVRIDLVPETVTFTGIGQRAQLEATARDTNGHPVEAEISYASSDLSVAMIDDAGLVTAQGNGVSTVTATAASVSGIATVTVAQVLASVAVAPNDIELTAIGESVQLLVTTMDHNGVPMAVDVSLSSSDPAIVSVNATGLVTAQANGTATVTATAGSVSGSARVTVDQQVARVIISPADFSSLNAVGATVQLNAIAHDANGHTVNVELAWTSSDPSVATVDGTGFVTAQGDGVTEIRAASGSIADVLRLDLALRPAALITVTPPSSLLEAIHATVLLEVEVLDADGQAISAPVDWTSSEPTIAEVNASGLVTAVGNGTATITARNGKAAGTATVRVLQRVRSIRVSTAAPHAHSVRLTSLGETVQYTAEALDSNANPVTGAVFTASSYDTAIVSIDDRLVATAVGNGHTFIDFRAHWAGRSPVTTHDVRVRQVAERIEIEPARRTFRSVGESHPFAATARDANGHALPAEFLFWATNDRRIADVDATGLVSISGIGETTITVLTAEWLSASATVTGELLTRCALGDRTPSIDSVASAALVEGTKIEIQGQGFCGDSAGNLVTIDGMVAAVEASTETRLSVTVPQFDCLPSRSVALTVAVGRNGATLVMDLEPDEQVVSIDVGRQALWGAGEDKCLQFADSADEEAYLIGVQSTSLTQTDNLTPIRLTASASEPDGADAVTLAREQLLASARSDGRSVTESAAGPGGNLAAPDGPTFEAAFTPGMMVPAPAPSVGAGSMASDTITFPDQGDIDLLPEDGDIVMIPDSTVEWVVYNIGDHALWLVDKNFVERMDAHYAARIDALSEAFDQEIYPIISDYFGTPNLGKIDRVVVTISREYGVAGATSSQGRAWHRITVGLFHGLDILAHEFIHAVQHAGAWNRPKPRSLHPVWFSEAQAQLGTEIYLLIQSNRSMGQNYGRAVVRDRASCQTIGWCANFAALQWFFGGAHPERPQECSWLLGDSAPCSGDSLFYFERGKRRHA